MSRLDDPERLAALGRSGLLDAPRDVALDAIVRLASQLLVAPVSFVSLVDRDRQFFASAVGLGEPWATSRQTPLSHSFCRHVVERDARFVVGDARSDPLVADNPAIQDLGLVAYCGLPLRDLAGFVLGSFCVADHGARDWAELDLGVLTDLEGSVRTALAVREVVGRSGLGPVTDLARLVQLLVGTDEWPGTLAFDSRIPRVEVPTLVHAHLIAALLAHAVDTPRTGTVRLGIDGADACVRVSSPTPFGAAPTGGPPFGLAVATDLTHTTGCDLEVSEDGRELRLRVPVRS